MSEECFTCMGRGYITRTFGTVAAGAPAVKEMEECPDCDGTGMVEEDGENDD